MGFELESDNRDLRQAVEILEFPSFTAKAAKYIGKPIEAALRALPSRVMSKVNHYTELSLKAAFRVVLLTVDADKPYRKAKNRLHKGLVVASGAAGGFLGGATMAVELPVSTGIMMRSIAEVAREEGEDLRAVEPRLACLAVLGLDTTAYTAMRNKTEFQQSDGVHMSGYFYLRNTMAREITRAAEYLVASTAADEGAPVVVKLLNKVAERFGIQMTEKMAAEWIPVIGAVAGGGINYLFIDHFQRIARGHFIIRRLERKYGTERVQFEYEAMLKSMERPVGEEIVLTDADITVDVEEEVAAGKEE